jgi:1-phosphatidylinositol-3-phosphate 5-kinase
MLAKSRADKRNAREPKLNDTGEAFMPDDRSVAESTSTWGLVNVDATDSGNPTEDMRVTSPKLPWVICKFSYFGMKDRLLITVQHLIVEA